MAQSVCFELMKGVPAAVVALLVGVVAGLIAWRQYRVARAKLNLDLFEKRYEAFQIVWAFASAVVQRGPLPFYSSDMTKMLNELPKIEFLFGKKLAAYVRVLNANHASLWAIDEAIKTNNGVMPQDKIQEHTNLMKWFADEAMEGVRVRFGEYLDFEEWR
ncbi:hypothetical protein [Burkholderia sp. SCN-KJ]|uniref:hypothetical protein n=1 Tax=Burkholderia sp. SCN-KJ TaxID=2969248 RepID=UPI0021504407|nr:hypothetical protein [Burkholderia sp. SCN-KJ]MCR4471067.1 hypothetical protein [Burkholderia sp. SCN-KJ]